MKHFHKQKPRVTGVFCLIISNVDYFDKVIFVQELSSETVIVKTLLVIAQVPTRVALSSSASHAKKNKGSTNSSNFDFIC